MVELQGHSGPVVQRMLLEACLQHGAQIARPGEFSQRAFLNDRMDLTQAEAIADLIDAGTEAAVRAANRSLEGVFSRRIHELQESLTHIRIFVEAALDFPDEDLDFIANSDIPEQLQKTLEQTQLLVAEARRGCLVREGVRIAIVGRPNAGKSSLLNQLAQRDIAIVTDIAGTTRDTIEQSVDISGVPVTLVDTAGLNDQPDTIEQLGIERTIRSAENADILIFLYEISEAKVNKVSQILGDYTNVIESANQTNRPVIYVANKVDLNPTASLAQFPGCSPTLGLSATLGTGIPELLGTIKSVLELDSREPEFSARSRQLQSLKAAQQALETGQSGFDQHQSPELLAEDLRLCQKYLSEITGSHTADDLLGDIFSSFCIGK